MEQNTKQALSQTKRVPGFIFRDLPPEIRLMIWDAIMDSNERLISANARRPKPSVALWVNQESRSRAAQRGAVYAAGPGRGDVAVPGPQRARLFHGEPGSLRARHENLNAYMYWSNPWADIISIDESRWGLEDKICTGRMDFGVAVQDYNDRQYSRLWQQSPRFHGSLASVARRCIVKEFLCQDSVSGTHCWDAAVGHGRCKQTQLGKLSAQMDTIFVRPFCLDLCYYFSRGVILSLNPEHIRLVQSQLFGEDEDFLLINLLNAAQVQRAIEFLSSCENETIGNIVYQIRRMLEWFDDFESRGLQLTWWQMVVPRELALTKASSAAQAENIEHLDNQQSHTTESDTITLRDLYKTNAVPNSSNWRTPRSLESILNFLLRHAAREVSRAHGKVP